MKVRAFYRATKIENVPEPYNNIHLKVFYPATLSGNQQENNFGVIPADNNLAPFPVIIIFNGINCHLEQYQWLAIDLTKQGFVTVTFAWIAENLPNIIALTPGVDIASLAPNQYGKTPTASALPALLAELEKINQDSVLAGLLDLKKIVLGGHSAGGRVAIENGNPDFFSSVVASFGYGVHTAAGTMMGYKPATILPLPNQIPVLLMGGTCDGVIANSSIYYNTVWEKPTTPVSRTFTEAITGGRDDSYLLLLEGANHFTFTYPFDPTVGTSFLDFTATKPEYELRLLMAEIISLFLLYHVKHLQNAKTSLNQYLEKNHPLIAQFTRK